MAFHQLSPESFIAGRKGLYLHPLSPLKGGLTVLQLSFDGPNGSTTIVDDTGRHSPVAVGTGQISTAQSKFGGASFLADGAGYARVSASPDFDLGSVWEVDFWARPSASQNNKYAFFMAGGNARVSLYTGVSGPDDLWNFDCFDDEGTPRYLNTVTGLQTNTWAHFSFACDGTTLRYWWDGALVAAHDVTGRTFNMGAGPVDGGCIGGVNCFLGNVDELRIRTGGEVRTEPFTPPTEAY